MKQQIKSYLQQRFKFDNLPKYQKYFDEWFENLTQEQIHFFCLDMYREINNIKMC